MLDFNAISQAIPFVHYLTHFNIPHEEAGDKIKVHGELPHAIVDKGKNLFLSPLDKAFKGSVINYHAKFKNLTLPEAAKELKKTFIDKPRPPKREIPTLTLEYHPYLEDLGISEATCQMYGVGYTKTSSMKGRICFKIGEHYLGFSPEKKDWNFPKNFKRDTIWNLENAPRDYCLLTADLFDCLHLLQLGFPYAVSIAGQGMTEPQAEIMARYKRIILFHKQPLNTLARLASNSFVKAYPDQVRSLTSEDVRSLF